jgi:hypothetical protein
MCGGEGGLPPPVRAAAVELEFHSAALDIAREDMQCNVTLFSGSASTKSEPAPETHAHTAMFLYCLELALEGCYRMECPGVGLAKPRE